MRTDESTRAPTSPLDLASAFGANASSLDDTPPLAASSSQSDKRRRRWLDTLGDVNLCPRKLFSEDSARNADLLAHLPVDFELSSSAIANAIQHDRIYPQRPSPARLESSRHLDCVTVAAARLTAVPSFASDHSVGGLLSVSCSPAASSRLFIARFGGSRRLSRLRGSGPSPNSPFSPSGVPFALSALVGRSAIGSHSECSALLKIF